MSNRTTLHATIEGLVQGVFFRASTRDRAVGLGLDGWVRNLQDGRVEVYAVGEAAALRDLERWLHEGPRGARVERVEAVWGETGEPSHGFIITS